MFVSEQLKSSPSISGHKGGKIKLEGAMKHPNIKTQTEFELTAIPRAISFLSEAASPDVSSTEI